MLSLSENMDAEGKTKPNQEVENKTYNKMYLENVQRVLEKINKKLEIIM